MPNIFDSVSIQEAIIDFGGLNKKFSSSDEDLRKCGKNFTHFVCLMIFPPCKKPKRPSRFLCESVKAGCPESVVRNWPEKFKCNLFPERESEDYVGMSFISFSNLYFLRFVIYFLLFVMLCSVSQKRLAVQGA